MSRSAGKWQPPASSAGFRGVHPKQEGPEPSMPGSFPMSHHLSPVMMQVWVHRGLAVWQCEATGGDACMHGHLSPSLVEDV